MTFPVKDEETQVYRVISEISKVTPSKNNSRHEPHFQIRSIKYSPPMATDLLPPTRLPVTPNEATAQVRRTLPEALSVSRSLNSPPRRVRRAGSPTPIPHPPPDVNRSKAAPALNAAPGLSVLLQFCLLKEKATVILSNNCHFAFLYISLKKQGILSFSFI